MPLPTEKAVYLAGIVLDDTVYDRVDLSGCYLYIGSVPEHHADILVMCLELTGKSIFDLFAELCFKVVKAEALNSPIPRSFGNTGTIRDVFAVFVQNARVFFGSVVTLLILISAEHWYIMIMN